MIMCNRTQMKEQTWNCITEIHWSEQNSILRLITLKWQHEHLVAVVESEVLCVSRGLNKAPLKVHEFFRRVATSYLLSFFFYRLPHCLGHQLPLVGLCWSIHSRLTFEWTPVSLQRVLVLKLNSTALWWSLVGCLHRWHDFQCWSSSVQLWLHH